MCVCVVYWGGCRVGWPLLTIPTTLVTYVYKGQCTGGANKASGVAFDTAICTWGHTHHMCTDTNTHIHSQRSRSILGWCWAAASQAHTPLLFCVWVLARVTVGERLGWACVCVSVAAALAGGPGRSAPPGPLPWAGCRAQTQTHTHTHKVHRERETHTIITSILGDGRRHIAEGPKTHNTATHRLLLSPLRTHTQERHARE